MTMPRIFIMECGWQGSIVVLAMNEEEAREFMSDEMNYDEKYTIKSFPIDKVGHIYTDIGDM